MVNEQMNLKIDGEVEMEKELETELYLETIYKKPLWNTQT